MKPVLYAGILAILLTGCTSLMLRPADFSWASEEILKTDGTGMLEVKRYSMSFNTSGLFLQEFADSSSYKNATVRIIRDADGYYYIAAPKFKSVYVFKQAEGALGLEKKIVISETAAMPDPKFNQRESFIELINGKEKWMLTKGGVQPSKGGK